MHGNWAAFVALTSHARRSLHVAAKYGTAEALRALLDSSAAATPIDVNAVDAAGKTALVYATAPRVCLALLLL